MEFSYADDAAATWLGAPTLIAAAVCNQTVCKVKVALGCWQGVN